MSKRLGSHIIFQFSLSCKGPLPIKVTRLSFFNALASLCQTVLIPFVVGLKVIINFNALPWLLNLLSSSKKGIRKEACWTISNITAGNKEQIQAVIEANIIPPLIQLLSNAEFDIRKVRRSTAGLELHRICKK